ncbi:related to multidrug resistance protein fnx1 [Phialocephala subalpina]|uniref:Related to multidrug resistance protein fnx1 n=1 Tax=Phialocephala subalpina TaxID=576137 RepID=A0A1L7WQA4_9HELO|nr:related to multidrug resistance protein fnx1 [Phialocephala subalpina]
MAPFDFERDGKLPSSSNGSSSFGSSSFGDYSITEETSLLSSESKPVSPTYQSTEATEDDVSDIDAGIQDEKKMGKSVLGILSLLMIGVFVGSADSTLVLATTDTIASEFGSLGLGSWLSTSYLLSMCAFQPLMGKLSDIYGRKIVLIVGYANFAIGSLLCGVGETLGVVILGRVICGLGAASMTLIVSLVITDLVPLLKVAFWRSYMNVVMTIGRAAGGPIGGLLADSIGWRWSFAGQAPLLVIAIIVVYFFLPNTKKSSPTSLSAPPDKYSRLKRIDFVGSVLLAAAIVILLGALSLAGQSLAPLHPIILGSVAGSIVLFVLFGVWEVKFAHEPVFPPGLLIQRDIITPYTIVALLLGAQYAVIFFIPLYPSKFRISLNESVALAGTRMFPAVLGNTLGGLFGGLLIARTGYYKTITIFGSALGVLCYLVLILRWTGNTGWLETCEIVPGGFGLGICLSSAFIALTSGLEHKKGDEEVGGKGKAQSKDMASATSGFFVMIPLGLILGIAVASSVQVGTNQVLLTDALKGFDGAEAILDAVSTDVNRIWELEEPLRTIVVDCYVQSFRWGFGVSLVSATIATVLSIFIREYPLRK